MFKLVFEKAEEPEIKLPTSTGSSKKQESSRKTSISALLTMPKPLTIWITTKCGKFFKRWEYQITLPDSWETHMQVKKQQSEVDMEQWTGLKLGKEYVKASYCHPAYLTYMQSTSCEMPGWMKHKLESRLPGETTRTSAMQMTPPNDRKWRGTKEPLYYSEGREWKFSLKLNIQKVKNLAPGPITSWQIDGEKVETMKDFIFLASKITADSDCSHEIKRCLLLGSKVMTNLDSALKSRGITLPTKVHLVKAMVFPVVMYGCESWTIKKAEWASKNWCFWTVVLEKTLASPLDCKKIQPVHSKGDQSWVFIGRTDAKAETPILRPRDVKSWFIQKRPWC